MGIFIIINGSMFALRLYYSPIVRGSTNAVRDSLYSGEQAVQTEKGSRRGGQERNAAQGEEAFFSPGSSNRPVAENRLSMLLQAPHPLDCVVLLCKRNK